MTNLLNRNVFQKLLRLTNYALFIGENLVLKILKKAMLVVPVHKNVLASFHEIQGGQLQKTASNRQVCL